MRQRRETWELESYREIVMNGSQSMNHYSKVTENSMIIYGKLPVRCDYFIMRLRLGYKYYWEYKMDGDGVPCKLCHKQKSHTLRHYIMACSELNEFRKDGLQFEDQICYLINYLIIKDILRKFKKFDIRF